MRMAALSSTSELRVELQRVKADKNLSVEEKHREIFMIMNMQNLNQNHNAVLPPAQSMGNMSALNSRTNIDEQESRLRMSQEETMDEDECENECYLYAYKDKLYCPHYPKRRVWMHNPEAPLEYYPCRLCYADEVERQYALDVSIYSTDSANYELPKLDRYKVKYMKCRSCLVSQQSNVSCQNPDCYWFDKAQNYYCDICHLWCDDEKPVFHCDKCGLCRLGNRDDYIHCNGCNLCIHAEADHDCAESRAEGTCPVCLEPLHDSQQAVVWSKCNHMFHGVCLETLLKTSFRCPVCKKCICDMDNHWNDMDSILEAENENAPEEYKEWKWQIFCNDCQYVSIVLYNVHEIHKCLRCGSYNTSPEGRYTAEVAQNAFEDESDSEEKEN